ncbi:hypothetical protein BHE74_00057161 [Ensete ventricosum]|nr:hypothetical protein BHE74_00057161 [Ensete ventricosum]
MYACERYGCYHGAGCRVQQAAGSDEGWLQLLATVGQGCDRGGYGRCDYGKGKKMRRARLEVTGRGEKA